MSSYALGRDNQPVVGNHENVSDARETKWSRRSTRCSISNARVHTTSGFVGDQTPASNEMSFDTQKFILQIESRKAIWDLSYNKYSNRDIQKTIRRNGAFIWEWESQ